MPARACPATGRRARFTCSPTSRDAWARPVPAAGCCSSDEDFSLALLEEAHVAVVHGAAFGMSPYVRISYATDDASLARGMERIATFCRGLR